MPTGSAKSRQTDYITPEGAKKLRDELIWLWKEERPTVTQRVSEAAAEGDRSENAEYIYGKRRLREIDRRIRFLTGRLDILKIVEPRTDATSKVYFGAWVGLEDEEGKESLYRIVGPDEFDPAKGWISIDSPVGKALLGKHEGDEVLVSRPVGTTAFTIVSVSYEMV